MKDRNDEIRQANRRALPKFLLMMVCCGAVGGAIGFCLAFFGAEQLAGAVRLAGITFGIHAAPWLLLACAVLNPIIAAAFYLPAKKLLARWGGEDEDDLSAAIDRKIGFAMWSCNLFLIAGLALLSISFAGMAVNHDRFTGYGFVLAIVSYFAVVIGSIMIQRRTVDMARRISPEKQGSIYEMKFRKKWLDSCDEAEKIQIGQCAYKAYTAANYACVGLWAVLTISGMFLDTGFLAPLAVCIILAVMQSVYTRASLRQSRGGANPL